jgi:ATP-dependent DNA ligase
MLAQLGTRLPRGDSWRYEPKFDGFRGLLWRPARGPSRLLSRNARDLGPWFPELIQAADQLSPGTLLGGEIVICDETGSSDFGSLQERLSTARSHLATAFRQRPAVMLVFDALELASVDLTSCPLAVRRHRLEQMLDGLHPSFQLVTQTADAGVAEDWLRLPTLEGVVAKRIDRPYMPGRTRDWVKVKRQRTVDCVVVGVAGDASAPKLVLALQHDDDRLHHLGRLGGVICT